MTAEPLITIGIPTHNRLDGLRRAVRSALAQDCGGVEVLISDNASMDGTEAFCRDLERQCRNVRYLRHPVDRGPTANFNAVLRGARGKYFQFLSDDDWLEPSHAARCIAWLRSHPGHTLVRGRTRYVAEHGATATGMPLSLEQPSGAARVRAFISAVDDGAIIYGVIPREVLDRVSDIPNVLGNDWIFVSELAFLGKIRTLEEVTLHRNLGGTSSSHRGLAATLGLSPLHAVLPYLAAGCAVVREVGWRSPVYARLRRPRRLLLAASCLPAMVRRQAWVVVLAFGRPRATRWAYRALKHAYLRIDQRTGGRLALHYPGHSTATPTHTRDDGV